MMNRNNMMNPNNMMKQAQEMQKRLAQVQDEIANSVSEASVGGGAVTATVTGGTRLTDIQIDPEVVDPEDVEMLQDLVMAAVNEAIESAQQEAEKKMSAITGGLNIPGLNL